MAEVVLENVHKNYGTPEDAVKGVSFTCHEGEFMVLLGPSGCGKTTTLRMITGLEEITSGKIMIAGKVVNNLSPQQRNVAMAFETYALYPPLTVWENIAFPLQVMKLDKNEIEKRVKEVAQALSIMDILDSRPESLAGGQKQRVSLARALVRDPTVFLMDEPLSHVDADLRYQARVEIKHMQAVSNATVIYVTHDQIEAVAMADRVVVMDLGVIQQIGTPVELFRKPANLFVAGFIGEPPMNTFSCRLALQNERLILYQANDHGSSIEFSSEILTAESISKLMAYNDEEIIAGIRPQHLKIDVVNPDARQNRLAGTLLVHEFLGKEGIAQVSVDQYVYECMTDPEIPFKSGEAVDLIFDLNYMHFFNPQTTQRIKIEMRNNGNIGA